MVRAAFATVAVSALLWAGVLLQPAEATSCTSNAQCPSNLVCQPALIPGSKECKELRCNANTDCPADRGTCEGGSCFAPAGTPGGSVGGIPLSGEGQACGPRNFGHVTKTVPCKPGLQCKQNICRKPLT